VDQVVELERVDLAAVESREAVPHVLKQAPQLLVVVGADQLTSRASPHSLAGLPFAIVTDAHRRTVAPRRCRPTRSTIRLSNEPRSDRDHRDHALARRASQSRAAAVGHAAIRSVVLVR
jgi:hypothetical protein